MNVNFDIKLAMIFIAIFLGNVAANIFNDKLK